MMASLFWMFLFLSPPSNLEVVKFEWSDWGMSTKTDVTVVFKNTGTKTINIVWYWVVYHDPDRDDRIEDKLTLMTDKPIQPGEERKFKKVKSCCTHSKGIKARLMVMKIEYSDGSIWERSE